VPVTELDINFDSLTMSITTELSASREEVWQLWSNPRLLEKWWGPPTYPATFVTLDLVPGGRVWYFMSGPNGERVDGWWTVEIVEAPALLTFQDGFADDTGTANPAMPIMQSTIHIEAVEADRTRMRIEFRFATIEQMQQIMDRGMEEGMKAAMSQIDALL
jgi:uncharacterized protein YndB with AHSA1/START domain